MALFGKREVIFKILGRRELWKKASEQLKAAGIKVMEAGTHESELPICSCGAKIDRRNYGPKGWIDRNIYYLAVRPADVPRALTLLRQMPELDNLGLTEGELSPISVLNY